MAKTRLIERTREGENTMPVCVTLEPTTLAALDRIARREQRSRSYIVRRAIELYFTRVAVLPSDLAHGQETAT